MTPEWCDLRSERGDSVSVERDARSELCAKDDLAVVSVEAVRAADLAAGDEEDSGRRREGDPGEQERCLIGDVDERRDLELERDGRAEAQKPCEIDANVSEKRHVRAPAQRSAMWPLDLAAGDHCREPGAPAQIEPQRVG